METNNKLREAVIETQSVIAKCIDILNKIPDSCGYGGLVDDVADELCDLREEYVKSALAEPPRNCDVGTAEEQEVRFRNYCWNHSSRDKNMECQCPIDAEAKAGCKLTWAQMPYEEGGEK